MYGYKHMYAAVTILSKYGNHYILLKLLYKAHIHVGLLFKIVE